MQQTDSNKAYLDDDSPLPDVLLPGQFFDLLGAKTLSSEQRLMLAVLADAINVLGSTDSSKLRRRKSFNEASAWVFAKGVTSPLSFDHVCDALNVNAESLRSRLYSGEAPSVPRWRTDHRRDPSTRPGRSPRRPGSRGRARRA